jgi:hypothetical protein
MTQRPEKAQARQRHGYSPADTSSKTPNIPSHMSTCKLIKISLANIITSILERPGFTPWHSSSWQSRPEKPHMPSSSELEHSPLDSSSHSPSPSPAPAPEPTPGPAPDGGGRRRHGYVGLHNRRGEETLASRAWVRRQLEPVRGAADAARARHACSES